MAILIEKEDYDFFLRSVKFCSKIDKYSSLLNLDPSEVDTYKNENELFSYVFCHTSSYGTLAESFMKHKISNMQVLFHNLALKCKKSHNYTEQIGRTLGILATEAPIHQISYSPMVNISYSLEGHPVLKWVPEFFEEVEIWKNSGDGKGYQKLDCCRNEEYTDKTTLPANKCEVWKYSIIYLVKDHMVGNWSDEREAKVCGLQS